MLAVVCVARAARSSSGAGTDDTERLQTLAKAITFDWAKSHPLTATFLGLSDEDGQLDTPSEAENARDLATIRGWESELASIPLDGASLVDVDDAKLLRAQLTSMERQYTVYKTYEKDPSGAITGDHRRDLHAVPAPADCRNCGRYQRGRGRSVAEDH